MAREWIGIISQKSATLSFVRSSLSPNTFTENFTRYQSYSEGYVHDSSYLYFQLAVGTRADTGSITAPDLNGFEFDGWYTLASNATWSNYDAIKVSAATVRIEQSKTLAITAAFSSARTLSERDGNVYYMVYPKWKAADTYIWAGNNQRTVAGSYLYEQFYVTGLSPYATANKQLGAWSIDGQYSRPAGDALQIARYRYSKSTQYQMSVNFTQQVVYNGATYSYCGTLICEYSSSSTLPQRYEQTATSYTFSPSVQGGTEWCLVPVYQAVECTLTCNGNGGYPSTQVVSFRSGDTVEFPAAPTYAGYTFDGWLYSGTLYQAGDTLRMTANGSAIAQWTAEPYVFGLLDATGGMCTPAILNLIVGSAYGTLPTPKKPNYIFDGWFTAASGGTQVTSATTVTSTVTHTLYAHWTARSTPAQDGELIYDDTTGRLIYDDRPIEDPLW